MKLIALVAALGMAGAAAAQDVTTQDSTVTTETTVTTGAGTATAEDPVGGYQPSAPPMSAPPLPGQTVIFKPSPTPSEAYPAPAPLQHYPLCKKGQYDNCRQRGG